MTVRDSYNDFILDKRAQGLTDKSIESYKNALHVFIMYIGADFNIDLLELRHIKEYAIELRTRNLSSATISTYMRNVKVFLQWVSEEFGLAFAPSKIKVPKSPKKKVHIYSDDEIHQIFSSIHATVPWIAARNRAMVAFMLDSGIRQSEICGLKMIDIDFGRNMMKVHGKGEKERYVPFGKYTLYYLREYLAQCPYQSEYVFLDIHGKVISGNAIRLFTYRLQQELPFEFSSHRLRHNFATNFCLDSLELKNTTGVFDLSVIMGHSSIETTKRYEHLAHELIAVNSCISHLDKIYNGISPDSLPCENISGIS